MEYPVALACVGVKSADKAIGGRVAIAACQAHQHLAVNHDDAARFALGRLVDHAFPDDIAGARIERMQLGVGGRDEHLVLVEPQAACAAVGDGGGRTEAIFPDQLACASIEGLHGVGGI